MLRALFTAIIALVRRMRAYELEDSLQDFGREFADIVLSRRRERWCRQIPVVAIGILVSAFQVGLRAKALKELHNLWFRQNEGVVAEKQLPTFELVTRLNKMGKAACWLSFTFCNSALECGGGRIGKVISELIRLKYRRWPYACCIRGEYQIWRCINFSIATAKLSCNIDNWRHVVPPFECPLFHSWHHVYQSDLITPELW